MSKLSPARSAQSNKKINIKKLILFRKYKDPTILAPQFHPLYQRALFLHKVEGDDASGVETIESKAKELIEFVSSLEMGKFYGEQLNELVGPLKRTFVTSLAQGTYSHYERQRKQANLDYRKKLLKNKEVTFTLLVELLRYQNWGKMHNNH